MDEKRRVATVTPARASGNQEALVDTIQAAVAEAVADQEERLLRTSQEPPKKRSSMSVFLLVVLLGFIGSSLYSFFEIREMALPIDEEFGVEAEAAGVHLYSVAMRLESFKEENGHYPASLNKAGLPEDQTLTYRMISDTEYSMEYASDGVSRSYHSSQPPTRLLQ